MSTSNLLTQRDSLISVGETGLKHLRDEPNPKHVLSFEEDAEVFVHRSLVLGSIDLAFLQRLDGAELPREPLKQGLPHVEGLEHSLVKRPQLPVNLDLRTEEQNQLVGSHSISSRPERVSPR